MQQKQSMKEYLAKSKADRANKALRNPVTAQGNEQKAANDDGLAEHLPPQKKPFNLKARLQENRERKERDALALANIKPMPSQENAHADNDGSEATAPLIDGGWDDEDNESQPLEQAIDDKKQEIANRPAVDTSIEEKN